MKIPALLLALFASACATVDRPAMSTFEPIATSAGKTFKYKVRADIIYPLESKEAEAERVRWLELYLSENKFCPGRYEITDRTPIAIDVGLATVHDVFYTGRCKG